MLTSISIGERVVGPGAPVFIIAEAGVNHNGRVELAKRLIDAAVEAGADAVKFQTFKAEKLSVPHAPKAAYQKITTDPAESQLEMTQRLELSYEAFRELKAYCDQRGILFMSTPFDEDSADFLDSLGVPVFKIPSGEVVNHPFLEHIARKGKPIIMSTGMSYLSEVDEAVRVIQGAGNDQLVLLHCVSNYPAAPADANLRAMQTLQAAFQVPVGYSDHTLGIEVALAAVALGACEALGDGRKVPAPSEEDTRHVVRRSLVLREDVPRGATIQASMLTALRPANGIPPNLLSLVVGRKAARPLKAGTVLQWKDLR